LTVVDNVNQHNDLTLSFSDPSDLHVNDVNGKPTHLVFHADSIQKTNAEDSILVNIDPHFSRTYLAKLILKGYHHILHIDLTMSCSGKINSF
jgi:hypothetical protein